MWFTLAMRPLIAADASRTSAAVAAAPARPRARAPAPHVLQLFIISLMYEVLPGIYSTVIFFMIIIHVDSGQIRRDYSRSDTYK